MMVSNILLVDDDKDQVSIIQKAFEKLYSETYKIIPAYNGKECFVILNKLIPDLIILDIMMPEIDGWAVVDKLRSEPHWEDIPIIFLTARTDNIAEEAGLLIARDYIKKPIDIYELKIRIDRVLNESDNTD